MKNEIFELITSTSSFSQKKNFYFIKCRDGNGAGILSPAPAPLSLPYPQPSPCPICRGTFFPRPRPTGYSQVPAHPIMPQYEFLTN